MRFTGSASYQNPSARLDVRFLLHHSADVMCRKALSISVDNRTVIHLDALGAGAVEEGGGSDGDGVPEGGGWVGGELDPVAVGPGGVEDEVPGVQEGAGGGG